MLLILTITLIDVQVPHSVHLGDLLIMVPAITSWHASFRVTALVTIMTVGALMAIYLVRNSVNPPQAAALIATSVIVTIARYLAERRQRELVQVRAVAETAQRAILPPLPRRLGPLRLASVYLAGGGDECPARSRACPAGADRADRQRTFDDKEGIRRTTVEIDAEEVAASLTYATAKVTKAYRQGVPSQGGPAPAARPVLDSPSASPSPAPAEPHPF
ncbi:hypothetical protein ABZT28_40795 [Streptomyces sp. NPDC005388]|uniref:hypothetical protein n=1 Tax=Streptomyces sp. NPDC005388 TaxID=3156717 RepID=UPI00339EF7C6